MKWIIVIFAIITTGVFVLLNNQKWFISQGDMLLMANKPISAVLMYERALLNYIPFSPYNKEAIEKMEKLCKGINDKEYKVFCYETLRSSLYQLRSFYTPFGEKIPEIDKNLYLLKTELYIEQNPSSANDYQKVYNDIKAMMDYDPVASPFWSLIIGLSLIGWISSIIWGIFRGFSLKIGLIYGIFFGLWILGLFKA